jgi:phosphoglycerate dehydrogenase-like enzyme
MRVLISRRAHEEFGTALRQASPGAVLVLLGTSGSLETVDGTAVEPGQEDIEVAWATHDLFVGQGYHAFFDVLQRSTTLRWFQSPGAGVDSPLFQDLMRRGVRLSTSHVTSIPIAEFVLRSVLDVFQRADDWARARAGGRWDQHVIREVFATTWLVFGVGAIGTDVATRARAFGARVIGCRRHPSGAEPVDIMIRPEDLRATVGECDVVVLAAPATPETHHIVDEGLLAAMKPRSVVVNVARGSLVDEDALLAALDRGVPEVAVLDAVAHEPPGPDSPLWTHPRILLTPHNSFAGDGCPARNLQLFVDNLGRYEGGAVLVNEQAPALDAGAAG